MAFNKFKNLVQEKKDQYIHEKHQNLLKLLSSNDRNLVELNINRDHDDDFIEQACEYLHSNRFVTKVRITGREVSDVLPNVAGVFSKSKTIVFLKVSQCELDDSTVTPLFGGLIKNTSVVSLVLDNNNISNSSGICLMLQHNKTLQHLDLSNNQLGQSGDQEFAAIADALPSSSIHQLDLPGNGMSDIAAKKFAVVVSKHLMEMPLRQLDIGEELSVRPDTRKYLQSMLDSKTQKLKDQHLAPSSVVGHSSEGSSRDLSEIAFNQGPPSTNGGEYPSGGPSQNVSFAMSRQSPRLTASGDTAESTVGTDAVVVLSVSEHTDLLAKVQRLEKELDVARAREGSGSPKISPRKTEDSASTAVSPTAPKVPSIPLIDHQDAVQRLQDQLASLDTDHTEVVGQYQAAAREKDALHSESMELQRKVAKLTIESERGKSYQEQVSALQQTQMLSEKEIENLRESLTDMQSKQIAELSSVSESNRNLRDQLDKAAAMIAQAGETREKLTTKVIENERT